MPKMKRRLLAYAAPMALAGVFAGPAAYAQDAAPPPPSTVPLTIAPPVVSPNGSVSLPLPNFSSPDGVLNRARPEYDAIGLRVGDMNVLPSLEAGGVYNSNVFNTANNQKADWAFDVAPSIRLVSDFPSDALSVFLGSHTTLYNRDTSENTTDLTAAADARIDILRSANVTLDGAYQVLHEPRGAPDLPGNAAKPTEFDVATGQAAVNETFNRLQFSLGGSVQRYDYQNTALQGAVPDLDNHDRDHYVSEGYLQAGYELSPGYSAFVRTSVNDRHYDLKVDQSGFERDSDGYEVDGGIRFELTRLIAGQIFGGYLEQMYDDPSFQNFSGATYGAQLEWYPTGLTTVRLDAGHSVNETIIPGSSGYADSHAGLNVDHELLRNLIITVGVTYDRDSYNGINFRDSYANASLGVEYLLTRNMQVNLGYIYTHRDANGPGLDYSANIFRLGVTGKV
jgi:hypothetical protein